MSLILIEGLFLNPAGLLAKEATFESFLHTPTTRIQAITSNKQALDFTRTTLGPLSQSSSERRTRARQHKERLLPSTITQQMLQLTAGNATWHFASELEAHLKEEREGGKSFFPSFPTDHLFWLQKASPQPTLQQVVTLAKTYFELAEIPKSEIEELPQYAQYTQYLHQQYSTKTHALGWVTIAEQEEAQGIIQRLHEYWNTENSTRPNGSGPSESTQQLYAARYLHHYYLPLHKYHLQITLMKLQMESERSTRVIWNQLRQWQTTQKDEKNLMRLCGTWQWLIHNHQNHGDHKTVMIYPPPSQYDRMDPKPAKIQVQGDTVFIRWEFPRGILQEESLLFSEKDRALSGTFVNNMGPNGNISARRVKPCKE